MAWFAKLIACYPGYILLVISCLCLGALYVSIHDTHLPDFEDPQLGFETRGTEIAERLTAWERLMDESKPSGSLIINPNDMFEQPLPDAQNVIVHNPGDADEENDEKKDEECKETKKKKKSQAMWKKIRQMASSSGKEKDVPAFDDDPMRKIRHYAYSNNFFCDSVHPGYAHVVFTSANKSDLFSYESVMEICNVQEQISSLPQYMRLCMTASKDVCCNMWSLPNYIAWLQKLPSCKQIKKKDVKNTLMLLEGCSKYYNNWRLWSNDQKSSDIPKVCQQNNGVFNLMHYIMDVDFIPSEGEKFRLENTALFLPIAKSSSSLEFFHEIENLPLSTKFVQIAAMDLGVKYSLFDEYLVRDTRLLILSCIFIVACMWLYTGCAFVTLLTVIAIVFSLILAYFIYTIIFRLTFFPFMNILAIIVALGIGSDDAYIMCKVWDRTKKENTHADKTKVVQLVIRHSVVAISVTTLTTIAAFLSSFVSSVTAIRCFSLFASLCVLSNFIFMITWILAGIVVCSDWPYVPLLHWNFNKKNEILYENILVVKSRFDNYVVSFATEHSVPLVFLLGFISILSMGSVILWPKLQVPDSAEFQLFDRSHPFEQYDLVYKHRFWFNGISTGEHIEEKLPLRFVWGVLPKDTGNYLDPLSLGDLHFDPAFDISSEKSQEWLLKFCRKLRMQPFYRSTLGPSLTNCFIETFKKWMEQKCIDPIDGADHSPCCETATFPYPRHVFNACVVKAMMSVFKTPKDFFMSDVAGPRFLKNMTKDALKIKAIVVEFDSVMSYTTSFEAMNRFYHEVDTWTKEEFSKAPQGMQNGWFVTHLAFYDLQRTLTLDTGMSVIISMIVTLFVLFVVTFNVPLSLFAILTITCIIFVSLSILIILGWKLNVLESVAISVAIGLSVDFSLHYAVNYKLCRDLSSRKTAVIHSLNIMAAPSLMAAITTGAAGFFMLPSVVLPYIQIGIFLIIVSTVSWIYSTFFLMPLLYLAGPENNFGQFSYSCIKLVTLRNLFKKKNTDRSLFSSVHFRVQNSYTTSEAESSSWLPKLPRGATEGLSSIEHIYSETNLAAYNRGVESSEPLSTSVYA